ncbi:SulP family sulfate permease [Eremomyces bilateralis CBS 781.70]|uniref:SulP family sulfate permease n=1 Tax=Eremomyces bilateralis CBS 781.70 TaxID=1392243 RepID=A0A6G1G364_9PEZI|nr:SulP family sulfate permease [Eremomyces bilateralis CBS 781.70]KAF1812249.1 SulP family sulfate permease [Eremomyces bilateralis CBS 781.70]
METDGQPVFRRHDILSINRYNWQTLRSQPLRELSGALGDLGTLLPLMTALTMNHSISLPTTLVFTGLANIATGVLFGVPLPVQPMKAIAAIAISNRFSKAETTASGLIVSAVVGLLSITGLLTWFARVVPIPIVKGIQMGAGLRLVIAAGSSLLKSLGWIHPSLTDNLIWVIAAFIFLIISSMMVRIPYALILFIVGLIIAFLHLTLPPDGDYGFHIWHPHVHASFEKETVLTGFYSALAQLPLTVLNSIIATAHLSSHLLPSIPAPSVHEIGISIAVLNLISCPFGGMPACHGSGGLAGQHRFGARSGASVIVLGLLKLVLGLFVGEGLVDLLQTFPKGLLGIMVIVAGIELAKVAASLNEGMSDNWQVDQASGRTGLGESRKAAEYTGSERMERWNVMLATVAGMLAFGNDAVGFAAGVLWHLGLKGKVRWERWQQQRNAPSIAIRRPSSPMDRRGERQSLLHSST